MTEQTNFMTIEKECAMMIPVKQTYLEEDYGSNQNHRPCETIQGSDCGKRTKSGNSAYDFLLVSSITYQLIFYTIVIILYYYIIEKSFQQNLRKHKEI